MLIHFICFSIVQHNEARPFDLHNDVSVEPEACEDAEQFFDAEDYANFEPIAPNREANLEEMAENFLEGLIKFISNFRREKIHLLISTTCPLKKILQRT